VSFFVANRTRVPVHVRLDRVDDAMDMFRFTFSWKTVAGGRPLTRFVLATTIPMPIAHITDDADFDIDDRIGCVFDHDIDEDGDHLLSVTGFQN
jgi:hypothetical protein